MKSQRPQNWRLTRFDVVIAALCVALIGLMLAVPDWDHDGKPGVDIGKLMASQ